MLEPLVEGDVTDTYQRFHETTRSEDPAAFVEYMVQEGLLRREDAARAAAELVGYTLDDATDSTTVVDGSGPSGSSHPQAMTTEMAAVPPAGRSTQSPIPRFELGPEIGSGGMGRVFRAEQVDLARPVAFKRLRKGHDEITRKRFLREARITARLDHPSIVPVYGIEVSADGRSIGYAMKLVEGKTLRSYLSETIELHAAARVVDEEHELPKRLEHFLKICDAVAFAHARGILHRDLKPSNFMIGGFNEVWVMDWGIARRTDEGDEVAAQPFSEHAGTETELTAHGEVIGSLRYMAPEQANASEIDARADQYALGLVLFEIVSLRPAMSSETTEYALDKAARGFKAPFEHLVRGVRIPPELAAIVDKATALLPSERYATVAALAEDVRRYLRGEAVVARPDALGQRVVRWSVRHRRTTLVGALGVLALAAMTIAWSLYASATRELAERRHGEARTAYFIEVATQARALDAEFQRMEEALEGLRTASEQALSQPEPTGDPTMYFVDDFAASARRPRDFTDKTSYRWPVSVDYPVMSLSPGTSRDAVMPQLRRLAPLRQHIRSMVVAAAVGDQAQPKVDEVRDILLQRKGPIDYAYVDLPAGVHYVWPGIEALPPSYDVRTAGFYRMSENRHGKRWGSPYVDSTTDDKGDDLVLPCTQGLWSPSGVFIGVAGVEITVTKLVETSLRLPGRATLRTTLVDGAGKKVIDSNDAGRRFQASGKDESMALFDFDLPEIVAAVKKGEVGIHDAQKDGRSVAVGVVKLDVLGWYYVVEVEGATLRGE